MLKTFRTFQLSVKFYEKCESLKLKRHLQDQLLRASSSISLNCAEGCGRRTVKDQKKFYHIAFGSSKECQVILILARIKDDTIIDLANHLAACLYKLCYKV